MKYQHPSLDELLKELKKQHASTDVVDLFRAKTEVYFKEIHGLSASEIEGLVRSYLETFFSEHEISVQLMDVVLYGSRCRGIERADSDLDIVFEFVGDTYGEDDIFNCLCEEPFFIEDILVDFNPIKEGESGTLIEYLPRAERYLSSKQLRNTDIEISR